MRYLWGVFILGIVLLTAAVAAAEISTKDNLQYTMPDTSGLAVELAAFLDLAPDARQARTDKAAGLIKPWLEKFEVRDGEVKQGLAAALIRACFNRTRSETSNNYRGIATNIVSLVMADLARAFELDPMQVEARVALGMILVHTGDPQDGVGHLLKARQILSSQAPAEAAAETKTESDEIVRYDYLREQIHYHLANAYRDCGLWDQAMAEVLVGSGITPGPAWRTLKGLCIAGGGDTSKAISYAVRMPPIEYRHQNSHHDAYYAHASDYANRWIKSQALFAAGDLTGARHVLGDLEFNESGRRPMAQRFWQDAGLVCELLEDPVAREYYGHVSSHAFFSWFYPSQDLMVMPLVLGYPDPKLPLFVTADGGFEGGSPFAYITYQTTIMVESTETAKVAKADSRALAMCETLLRRHAPPDLVRAFRARIHMVADRHGLAHPDLEFAQAGFSARELVDPGTSIMLGQLELLAGNNVRSRELFDEALSEVPDNALAWRELGVSLGRVHQYELARKAMDKAMELEPDSPEGWFNMGVLAYRRGQHEEALGYLETAWKLKPGDERIQSMLQTVASARRTSERVE